MTRAALLWGLCLALVAAPSPASARAAGVIHVGHVGYASDMGLFIAVDKGYFREQGIEVSLEQFRGAADQVALLGTGRLEVGSGTSSATLFNAIARGLPIVAVADKGSFRQGFSFAFILVRKALVESGRFRSLKDLKGLVMAVPDYVSMTSFVYSVVLKHAGLTARDVTIEYVAERDQPTAMANGKIDVALLAEPLASAVELRGIGKIVLPLDEVLPGFGFGLILYNRDWARRDPQQARRWMIAYVKGLRYYNEAFKTAQGRSDLITILAARTAITDRTVWERISWPGLDPDGTINVRSVLDHQRWLLSEHQISQFMLPDRFVDLSYAHGAARVLGPYQP